MIRVLSRSSGAAGAGPPRAYGATSSMRSPVPEDCPRRYSLTPQPCGNIAAQRPGKGGVQPSHRPLARRPYHQDPRSDRRAMAACRLHADGRQRRRPRQAKPCLDSCQTPASRALTRATTAAPFAGRSATEELSPTSRPRPTASGRTASRLSSSATQRHRAHVLPDQGFQAHRNALRPERLHFLAAVQIAAKVALWL